MQKTLKYIIDQFGEDTLRDGNKLITLYLDLNPRQKAERQMLEHLVKCNGNNCLMDAKKLTPKEKKKVYLAVVSLLMTRANMSEENAYKLCGIFLTAISEEPIDFSPGEKIHDSGSGGMPVASSPKKTNGKMIAAVAAAAVLLIALVSGLGGKGGQGVSEPVLNNPTISNSTSSNPTVPDPTEKATEADRHEQELVTASSKKLSQIKCVYGDDPQSTVSYEYNENGKVEKIDFGSDNASDFVIEYDDNGRFIEMESIVRGDAYDYSYLKLIYDDNRVTSLLWGNYDYGTAQWDYWYDENGRIKYISSGDDDIECEYDNSGRVIKASYADDGYVYQTQEYEYDADGRLSRIVEIEPWYDDWENVATIDYYYDYAPLTMCRRDGEQEYYEAVFLDYDIFEDIATAVPLLMFDHVGSYCWEGSFFFSYQDLERMETANDGSLASINAYDYAYEVQYEFVYSE